MEQTERRSLSCEGDVLTACSVSGNTFCCAWYVGRVQCYAILEDNFLILYIN